MYTQRKLYRQNYPSARWVVCWKKEAFNQWPVLALDELRVLLRWKQVAHQVAVQKYNQTKKRNRKDIKTNFHEILQTIRRNFDKPRVWNLILRSHWSITGWNLSLITQTIYLRVSVKRKHWVLSSLNLEKKNNKNLTTANSQLFVHIIRNDQLDRGHTGENWKNSPVTQTEGGGRKIKQPPSIRDVRKWQVVFAHLRVRQHARLSIPPAPITVPSGGC